MLTEKTEHTSNVARALRVVIAAAMLLIAPQSKAISFALDSIAEWGKFPRFVVNTYRWGCNFFNGYDTTYVVGTGYKFNTKIMADSWLESYSFMMPDNCSMSMHSTPSTSMGVYLNYMAVTVGYDVNVRKILGLNDHSGSRRRFRFGFNCALFAAELSWINSNAPTTINSFRSGPINMNVNIPFDGVKANYWNVDAYYFFNNKRYSEAGAFNYSRIQLRNQGSWFAGLSYANQRYAFDFSDLPEYIRAKLPQVWDNYQYSVSTINYCARVGYGYNWVFAPGWLLGVSVSPVIGVRSGSVTGVNAKTSFALANRLKASIVWNHGRWFAGAIGNSDVAVVYDRTTTMSNFIFSGEISAGYRFNLW